MKLRILSFVKRSLATRMSLVTVFFAAIILIAALGYMFNVSRQAIRKEAVDRATNQLENTVLRVTNILDQVEVACSYLDTCSCKCVTHVVIVMLVCNDDHVGTHQARLGDKQVCTAVCHQQPGVEQGRVLGNDVERLPPNRPCTA